MTRRKRSVMRDFGQKPRHTLPAVAITVAEMATKGEVSEEDANTLYLEYYMASAGISKADETAPAVKANASKLRQVIRAADPELLRRVSVMHDALHKKVPCKPLYHAMVDVCRHKLTLGGSRTLTDAAIKKLLLKPQ